MFWTLHKHMKVNLTDFFQRDYFTWNVECFFLCLEKISPKIYSEIQLNLTFNWTYSYGGHDTLATIYYIIPQLFCSHVLFSCVLFSCAKFIQSILQIIHHLKQSFYSLQFSRSSFVSIEFAFFPFSPLFFFQSWIGLCVWKNVIITLIIHLYK